MVVKQSSTKKLRDVCGQTPGSKGGESKEDERAQPVRFRPSNVHLLPSLPLSSLLPPSRSWMSTLSPPADHVEDPIASIPLYSPASEIEESPMPTNRSKSLPFLSLLPMPSLSSIPCSLPFATLTHSSPLLHTQLSNPKASSTRTGPATFPRISRRTTSQSRLREEFVEAQTLGTLKGRPGR